MNDDKCVCIMFVGIAIAVSASMSVKSWMELVTIRAAMENGYVQKIDKDSGLRLWVKADQSVISEGK